MNHPAAPLVNPQKQAKDALLATIAAAQRNPDGKDVAAYLTKLLGEMEGLGGSLEGDGSDFAGRSSDTQGTSEEEAIDITEEIKDSIIAAPSGSTITSAPITHLWDMPPQAAAKKRQELDLIWDALEREEEAWAQKQNGIRDNTAKEISVKPDLEVAPSPNTTHQSPPTSAMRKETDYASPIAKPKKSVMFDDGTAPIHAMTPLPTSSWGDIVPATLKGRIRPAPRAIPMMKYEILERMPSSSGAQTRRQAPAPADSDDEDEADGTSSRDDDDDDSDTAINRNGEPGSEGPESEDGSSVDEEAMLREASSASYARREVLLQKARNGRVPPIVRASGQAVPPRSMFVPLDASIGVGATSTSTSTWKPSSIPVTAIGSDATAVIREGKLVGNKLVVPADSESDDDGVGEAGKKTIALLRKRESDSDVPTGSPSRSAPISSTTGMKRASEPKSILRGVQERILGTQSVGTPNATHTIDKPAPTRVSRFKAMQQHAETDEQRGRCIPSTSVSASNEAPISPFFHSPTAPVLPPSVVVSSPGGVTTSVTNSFTIVDSPSFSRRSNKKAEAARFDADEIMSRDVIEGGIAKKPIPPLVSRSSAGGTPRVSRFKAERM
ncbi:hypothetical protein FRB98_005344 [Tulasnella sp. 332]|nr:hypothetical protein FRB98_005344 [Tulasnella sp. 332]